MLIAALQTMSWLGHETMNNLQPVAVNRKELEPKHRVLGSTTLRGCLKVGL